MAHDDKAGRPAFEMTPDVLENLSPVQRAAFIEALPDTHPIRVAGRLMLAVNELPSDRDAVTHFILLRASRDDANS